MSNSVTIYQPTIKMSEFVSNGVTYQDTSLDENNNILFVYDGYSVAQTVQNAVSLWQNEYQFNTNLGINWSNILGQPINRLLLNNILAQTVLSVQYVASIASIDYIDDEKKRSVFVTITYTTTTGTQGVANAVI